MSFKQLTRSLAVVLKWSPNSDEAIAAATLAGPQRAQSLRANSCVRDKANADVVCVSVCLSVCVVRDELGNISLYLFARSLARAKVCRSVRDYCSLAS